MTDALQILREDLLAERTIVVAGGDGAAFERLGARAERLALDGDEVATDAAVRAFGPVDALVVDAPSAQAREPLHTAADAAWVAARAVANAAWIEPAAPGGKIVFVAPAPASTEDVALRAAYENLARTLSIEWARFGIRTTTILPGTTTSEREVQAVVAYLLSVAGDYFSGAKLELS